MGGSAGVVRSAVKMSDRGSGGAGLRALGGTRVRLCSGTREVLKNLRRRNVTAGRTVGEPRCVRTVNGTGRTGRL